MALTKFVRNVEDLSDDGGYKFRFRCDQCSDGYETQYVTSSANLLKTAVDLFTRFTRFGYYAHGAANEIDRGLRGKERDAAYETAVHEAMLHFKKCSACGHWVCPEHCWNDPAGMCERCAPDAREAAGKRAAAQRALAAEQQATATSEVTSLSCATCGQQVHGSGKFCENCGAALAKRACLKCQAALSAGARFCGACGTAA